MKRRSFLGGLAAGAGTTVLPIPLAAKPVTTAASASQLAKFHYAWACVYAQMNNSVTPVEMAETFRISTAQANTLFNRMLDRGVLTPPGLDGRSHARRPWQPFDQEKAIATRNREAQQAVQGASERLQMAYQSMMTTLAGLAPNMA